MKSTEQFSQLVSYEGVADVYMETNAGKSGFRGTPKEFPSGRVTREVVVYKSYPQVRQVDPSNDPVEPILAGESVNGWTIACSGHNDFPAVQPADQRP